MAAVGLLQVAHAFRCDQADLLQQLGFGACAEVHGHLGKRRTGCARFLALATEFGAEGLAHRVNEAFLLVGFCSVGGFHTFAPYQFHLYVGRQTFGAGQHQGVRGVAAGNVGKDFAAQAFRQ